MNDGGRNCTTHRGLRLWNSATSMPVSLFWKSFCGYVEKCSDNEKEVLTCSEILGHETATYIFEWDRWRSSYLKFCTAWGWTVYRRRLESLKRTWEYVSFSSSGALTLNEVNPRSRLIFYVGLFCSSYGKISKGYNFLLQKIDKPLLKMLGFATLFSWPPI